MLSEPSNRLGGLLANAGSVESAVEDLYWAALSRPPIEDERNVMSGHVCSASDRRKGLEDVAWALLNSKEFVLRK
jgi:hypothetical protein